MHEALPHPFQTSSGSQGLTTELLSPISLPLKVKHCSELGIMHTFWQTQRDITNV